MYYQRNLGLSHFFKFKYFWCLTLIKIFPNYGPDEISAAKLINTDTTETGSRPPAPGIGVGGCDKDI
ncbi:hypothetical protein HanPSC8_Chr06g0233091 [Helianthus annuus]|nr:hypothetical protein HanPSC8_Chr06g0233091 [Helianthus annuus]